MRRSLCAVTAVTVLAVLGSAAAAGVTDLVAGTDAPEPGSMGPDNLSRLERATAVAGLAVMVERSDERLVARRETTYTIAVGNRGHGTERMIIRAVVPPRLTASPLDGGELGEGFVDWPVTLPPGAVTTLRLTGAYAAPEADAPARVTFTACALEIEDSQPIVCATDLAKLRQPWWDTGSWVLGAAASAGLAGVAGLAAAVRWFRRRRGAATGFGGVPVRPAGSLRPR